MTGISLDQLIAIEDAIEAIQDGVTREQYAEMHKADFRINAGEAYDSAQSEIWTYNHNPRKALAAVKQAINLYR